jgi:hypothetical protein
VHKILANAGKNVVNDVDARVGNLFRTALSGDSRVVDGIDNPRNACRDESLRARTGSTGVVAGLKRDDGREAFGGLNLGQCVNFCVGRSRTAVPPFGNNRPSVIEQDAPNLGVLARSWSAQREFSCTAHRVIVLGDHPDSF